MTGEFVDTEGYLSPEEIEKIISKTDNIRDRTIITFLYNTGCRVSEMLVLTTDDIDFKKGLLHMITLKRKANKKEYRYVPITTKNKEQLKYYLKWLAKVNHLEKYEGILFNTSRQNVHSIVKKRAENAGIRYAGQRSVHPHTFRHSFAVEFLKQTEDIRTLQLILGHSNINTTALYLKFGSKDLQSKMKEAFG